MKNEESYSIKQSQPIVLKTHLTQLSCGTRSAHIPRNLLTRSLGVPIVFYVSWAHADSLNRLLLPQQQKQTNKW